MILEHSNTRWRSWIWKSDPLKVTIFPKSPNNNHVREWNKKLPSPKEHSTEGCAAGMSRYHIYKTSLHSTGDCNYEGPILLASFQKRSNNILKYVFHKYIDDKTEQKYLMNKRRTRIAAIMWNLKSQPRATHLKKCLDIKLSKFTLLSLKNYTHKG